MNSLATSGMWGVVVCYTRYSARIKNPEKSPLAETCVNTLDDLLDLYGPVNPVSLAKETDHLTTEYRRWLIESPFMAVATIGPGGLDCSPRGDATGSLLEVMDDRTLVIPDRRGNNRLDTLRNLIADSRISLLFLIPGINETLRINGTACITTDEKMRLRFRVNGNLPVSVIRVQVEAVYFQCARALKRSALWDAGNRRDIGAVPSAGQMTKGAVVDFDAETYDAELENRQKKTLY